jgi:hypothetical protein
MYLYIYLKKNGEQSSLKKSKDNTNMKTVGNESVAHT